MTQTLSRSASALALAAFLSAGPAWAADPSPIPARGADEIGPRVIDLGPPAGTRITPAGDTTSRFSVHNPYAAADAVAYSSGYPGLWTGDGFVSRRGDHAFLKRSTIGSSGSTANVTFRGPRETFANGGIASPGISNFQTNTAIRSGIASPGISNFRSGVTIRSGGVSIRR
jgi:hypothetical protein